MYLRTLLLLCLSLVCASSPAAAQAPVPAPAPGVPFQAPAGVNCTGYRADQWRIERVTATHLRLTGQVEVECQTYKFFADEIDVYTDTDRLVAKGNVVFTNPEGRI